MSLEPGSELVSFDAAAAFEAAQRVTDDGVVVFAELTRDDYAVRYLDEAVQRRYGELGVDVAEVAESLHRYESLDFFEQETLRDLLPVVEEVTGFATFTDAGAIVRVLDGGEGVYVSLKPGANVTAVVDALRPIVADR